MIIEINEEMISAIRELVWIAEVADESSTDRNRKVYESVGDWLDSVQ